MAANDEKKDGVVKTEEMVNEEAKAIADEAEKAAKKLEDALNAEELEAEAEADVLDANPKSVNDADLNLKKEEEKKRREAEVKKNISAVYWDEYSDMEREKDERENKELIDNFNKNVQIEHERIKEVSKDIAKGTAVVAGGVVVGAGTVVVGAAKGVGKVYDAIKDAVDHDDPEDPEYKPFEAEGVTGEELAAFKDTPEVTEAQKNAEKASFWIGENGQNLLEYSMAFIHTIVEKFENGKSEPVHKISLSDDFDSSAVDRDKMTADEYQKYLDTVKEAQDFFKVNEDVLNETLNAVHTIQLGDINPEAEEKVQSVLNDPEKMDKLNHFRQILGGMKEKNDLVCKLTDQEKQPVLVDPLKPDVEFNAEMKAKENGILDTANNMLKSPADKKGGLVPKEYQAIMDSVNGVKESLNKNFENNDAAKRDYTKSVHKVLNDINRYRVHMASQNINLDENMKEEIIAVERVDKFFRTRFQTLEQREYEDTIGAVGELFKVETDKNAVGDDYVLQNGLGKINNMKKKIEDFKEEMKSAKNDAGQDELEAFINNPLEREVLPVEPEKEAEPVKVEDEHLKEQRDLEKEKKAEERKELEQGEKANDLKADVEKDEKALIDPNNQKEVNKNPAPERQPEVKPVRRKSSALEKNLEEIYKNDLLKAAIEKEADYRKNLEPKDEYGKMQLVLSAKKSMYLELLGQAAGKKMTVMDKEKVEDILNKGIKDFNKSAIKARAFMAEHVSDKDFNNEFGKRVIEGAQKGKSSHEDIVKFRDDALRSCYLDHKGKDIKELDKLSRMLGSDVNARSLGLVKDRVLEKKLPEDLEKKINERKLTPNKPLGMGM